MSSIHSIIFYSNSTDSCILSCQRFPFRTVAFMVPRASSFSYQCFCSHFSSSYYSPVSYAAISLLIRIFSPSSSLIPWSFTSLPFLSCTVIFFRIALCGAYVESLLFWCLLFSRGGLDSWLLIYFFVRPGLLCCVWVVLWAEWGVGIFVVVGTGLLFMSWCIYEVLYVL